MSIELITIHLFADQQIKVDINRGEEMEFKEMEYSQLLNCINESLLTDAKVDSGVLPPEVVAYGYEWKDTSQMAKYTLLYDRPTEDIRYGDTVFFQVPMPRLLFRFTVINRLVKEINLCALPLNGTLTEDMPVYFYPFSNIVPGAAWRVHIKTDLPRVETPFCLSALARDILRQPNTNETYNMEHLKNPFLQQELIDAALKNGREFYDRSVLRRIPDKTVWDFIHEK